MANYVFTNYAIIASKENLVRIAEAINSGDGYMSTAMEKLQIDTEDVNGRAEWETGAEIKEMDGKSVLFFRQAYPYHQEDDILNVLQELGENMDEVEMYWQSSLYEEDAHATNDLQKRFFPARFIMSILDDERMFVEDTLYFNTLDEVREYLYNAVPTLPHDLDNAEALEDYLQENELPYNISEIEEI